MRKNNISDENLIKYWNRKLFNKNIGFYILLIFAGLNFLLFGFFSIVCYKIGFYNYLGLLFLYTIFIDAIIFSYIALKTADQGEEIKEIIEYLKFKNGYK